MERLSLSNAYNANEFAIHSVRYLPLRGLVKNRNVLDIACGEGLGTNLLARWGAKTVTGVDISEAAIAGATERAALEKRIDINFVCQDAYEFLEQQKTLFDVIVCVETIEHLPDPQRFLQLCKEQLTPDGILLVSCPNDRFYYGGAKTMNRFHSASYTFDEFREMAEGILGDGDWALGTLLTGFGLVPVNQLDMTSDTYTLAYRRRQPLTGERLSLPPQHADALSANTSIFYVGMWGPEASIGSLAVALPNGADFRMREVRAVSPDVSLGVSRRLAFVHDRTMPAAELATLRDILAGKYDLESIVWDDDVAELGKQLLGAHAQFDNIHFESESALSAMFAEIEKRSLDPLFEKTEGAAWVNATLTARMQKNKIAPQIKDMIDGTFTYSAEMPVLWSTAAPDKTAAVSRSAHDPDAPFAPRIAVVLKGTADRNLIDSVIAPLPLMNSQDAAQLITVDAGLSDDDIAKMMADTDVVICLDTSEQSRPAIEQAIRRGLPVLLPAGHPHAALVGLACSAMVLGNIELTPVRKALKELQTHPELLDTIRRENLELAEEMASSARGVAWTRAFANAQQARRRQGGPLRLAAMKNRADCYRMLAESQQRDAMTEIEMLRAECDRLRSEQINASRLIAELTANLNPTRSKG